MRFPFAFIALLSFAFPCSAQLDTTGTPGALQHYDPSRRSVGIREYRKRIVALSIRNDATNKIFEEYFLRDDSSYYYFHYDSSGYSNRTGIIKINKDKVAYDTIIIPDWKNDPTGNKGMTKDTLIPKFIFEKYGYWVEKDSNGYVSKGNYEKNQKTGVWVRGKIAIRSHFELPTFAVEESILYYNGSRQPKNIAYEQIDSVWPNLTGRWIRDNLQSDRSLCWFFSKARNLDQLDNTIDFLDQKRYSFWNKFSDWHFEKGIIYLCLDGEYRTFQIQYLDDQVMYWKPLN